MSDEPAKKWELTHGDRRFLRSLRVAVEDVCPVCHGDGCFDCYKTGQKVKRKPTATPPELEDGA